MRYGPEGASHLPILIKVIQSSVGPVLELGAGQFSTPVMHWLCLEAKRKLVTYENDLKYYAANRAFQAQNHDVIFVDDWDKAVIDHTHWGVAFVDHRPADRRKVEIARLSSITDYIVVHDTEAASDYAHGFVKASFPLFKYRYNYRRQKPYTSVLSNFKDLTNL